MTSGPSTFVVDHPRLTRDGQLGGFYQEAMVRFEYESGLLHCTKAHEQVSESSVFYLVKVN